MQVFMLLLNIACNMQNMQNNMHDMQNMHDMIICKRHFQYAEYALPTLLMKYALIVTSHCFFDNDIKVQHFDIEVQHFDIEATKKLQY